MKPPATSFDWNQARAFLATAEEGSLSAAARRLGQTQPTLGRQVSALEEALGITLFERAGRSLRLTDAGRELLPHLKAMEENAGHVAMVAAGQAQGLKGRVTISASDMMAARVLPPIIARLARSVPELEITLLSANTLSDLTNREADIALRHVRPTEPELIARRVSEQRAKFYAASAYLERMGRPETLADLARHDWVGHASAETMLEYLAAKGIEIPRERVRVVADNGLAYWELMRHGMGVGIMAKEDVPPGEGIEPVLPEYTFMTVPVWLVAHGELHSSRRIRVVWDFLAEALSKRGAEA
ncbi:LysR family transcriptional regulator [Oceanicola sp. 502str15]|uniref:LysR family transcriptional regulator n=1 Tax=Oceanicola sp. 502str15 TaxID=2696061 RepID=UPI002094AA37|nr:LysR family transcriptional regulator [Oceanicola sp. 502str15]MCO6383628.1 LysR family transcriptional regulator [Oceanicola sp. 502str15]